MDNIPIDSTISPEQIKNYQMLLNNVFTQKLEHNKKQVIIWKEYKDNHKRIIEGLQIYPLSVSENCMIPIGKRALMKGKLIHTNEILVSLGCDYFAKYSASQAIALCNRRIAYANEMLKSLENEKNFYEMKQSLPSKHDVFGAEDRKDIIEHWSEDKLDKWRVQHKQCKKKYHQKLAKLKEKEEIDIQDEDLLRRLDELELEEEMYRFEIEQEFYDNNLENDKDYNESDNASDSIVKDEICRLKTEQEEFYGDDLESGEVYDESDDTSDSVITMEMIEEELKKLKELQKNKVINHTLKLDSDMTQDKTQILDKNPIKNEQSDLINSDQERLRRNCSLEFRDTSQKIHTRKVSFSEPCVINNEDNIEKETSQRICFAPQNDICDENSEDENDIRISFSHSCYSSNIIELNTEIKTPGDIYKVFNVPKSILKRSPNDIPNQIVPPLVYEDDSIEIEDENDHLITHSIYNSVVEKEIQERQISTDIVNTSKKTDKKKVVSLFKLSQTKKDNI